MPESAKNTLFKVDRHQFVSYLRLHIDRNQVLYSGMLESISDLVKRSLAGSENYDLALADMLVAVRQADFETDALSIMATQIHALVEQAREIRALIQEMLLLHNHYSLNENGLPAVQLSLEDLNRYGCAIPTPEELYR